MVIKTGCLIDGAEIKPGLIAASLSAGMRPDAQSLK